MTDRSEGSDIDAVVAALKKSGFSLQTRVEHEINARAGRGWNLLASEHPWRDEDSVEFIDCHASRERRVVRQGRSRNQQAL